MEHYFLLEDPGVRPSPNFAGYVVLAMVESSGPVAQGTVKESASHADSGTAWQGQVRLHLPNEKMYEAISVGETYNRGSINLGQCGETTHFIIWEALGGGRNIIRKYPTGAAYRGYGAPPEGGQCHCGERR